MSPDLRVVTTRAELGAVLDPLRRTGSGVALVPTMGALHEGHVSLFRAAREGSAAVVASLFVNPLQFAAGEDLARYPRTLDDDLRIAGQEGVDVVLAPAVEEMYPDGDPTVTVDPGPLGGELEGASRPGHFRGVLTVVARLFGLVRPQAAYFGEKDYQQLVLVRQLSRDLCLGVDVVGVPTVREPDGLALSSRNRFLDPAQRAGAVVLSQALLAAAAAASDGVPAARAAAVAVLDAADGVEPDYLEIRTPSLRPVDDELPSAATVARVLVAARVGTTRLIDNLPLVLGPVP